ncbi:Glycosyltransferase involved in cell wall bisynthesis [Anaerovirgula multivorans]|uniref:Glycosyltransferase involved in cell wall bisynthesis n=1 Tax=Anaerovirgula multivorans TaxID=312168 RepID=A0A239EG19_9FIRM|nr:glycosyltransferase [Anaerovirgula multivorans]SNS43596.1 Glycosyltransferase involved in cell wall bisynthesis [Anaerovirgula multivorans]
MGNKPLVSVAIITYNQEEYLKECIESVLAQDYDNIEIVVADDASQDGTQAMLKEYDKKYPEKFKLVLSKINQGITANSNNALFACKGKYIAWLGGDDLFLPSKITKQVKFMEANPELVISYHNIDRFDSNTGRTLYYVNDVRGRHEGNVDVIIEHGTFMGACSVMVLREACPKCFNPKIPIASDWLFWIETCYNGKIGYIDEILSKQRRHSNNITKLTTYKTKLKERILTLNLVNTKKISNPNSIRKAKARVQYHYALNCILNDSNEASVAIKDSIESHDLGWKQKLIQILIKFKIQDIYKFYYKHFKAKE